MRWIATAAMLCLGACQREQDFDRRFDHAQQRIEARAAAIEQALATEGAPPVKETEADVR